jgi:hypothetical protein
MFRITAGALLGTTLLVLLGACSGVAAQVADNPCKVTKNVNTNDTTLSCPSELNDWIQWGLPLFIGPVIALAVMILVFFFTPFTCCARYCCSCCGSSQVRPGSCCGCSRDLHKESGNNYTDAESFQRYNFVVVVLTKVLVVACFALSIAALALSFAGVKEAQRLPQALADGVFSLVDWILSIVMRLINALPLTDFSDISAVKAFHGQVSQIETFTNSSKRDVQNMADEAKTYLNYLLLLCIPTAIILFAALLGSIAAIFRIRYYVPMIALIFVVISALPTGLLAGVSGILVVPFRIWCEEVDAFKSGAKTSLFDTFFLPQYCSNHVNFEKIRVTLNDAAAQIASSTCGVLTKACTTSDTYSLDDAQDLKFFVCDPSTKCNNFDDLSALINSITLKKDTPGMCAYPCSLASCATNCSNDYKVREVSRYITAGPRAIANILRAIDDILKEVSSCDKLLNKLLNVFGEPICDTVYPGLKLVYSGACIGVTVNVVLVFLMFMGQKRFFAAAEAELGMPYTTNTTAFPVSLQGDDDDNLRGSIKYEMTPVSGSGKYPAEEPYPTGAFTAGLHGT